MYRNHLLVAAVLLAAAQPTPAQESGKRLPATNVQWKKIVIDRAFRSEGVAVADVNKDGKKDILAGDVWYEAPTWKMHEIRPSKDYTDGMKNVYSKSFACWTEDFNKDGWLDVIVIGFPGAPCHWYENPQNKPGHWKEHVIWHSACNETPLYVDLFKNGKRVLVMGCQPQGQDNMGQMAFFTPGNDPTKPWTMNPISEPSRKGKPVPGTFRFSHGLGVGDVNGDGRLDVICTGGWWEQPEKYEGKPWRFHEANLGPNCADMYALDIDGDGKNDIVSSSAHEVGFWWHRQNPDGTFARRDLFLPPLEAAKLPPNAKLSKEERELFAAVNAYRIKQLLSSPLPYSATLSRTAEELARSGTTGKQAEGFFALDGNSVEEWVKSLAAKQKGKAVFASEMRLGVRSDSNNGTKRAFVLFRDSGRFLLPGQTHALHHVDIDGDGVKDFVTGRRWWAHGPRGDYAPNDPAVLYWFKGRKNSDGGYSFEPHKIDDDSGIGTQFAVEDLDGDGLPDIIISNKRGTYLFLQVRTTGAVLPPAKRE